MSPSEADSLAPAVNLSKIINTLSPDGVTADRFIVMAPKYLRKLNDLIDETPRDVIQAYFLWKAIQSYSSFIEADAIRPYKRFSNELQGKVSFVVVEAEQFLTAAGPRLDPRTLADLCQSCR